MVAQPRTVDRAFDRLVDVDSRVWPGIYFGSIGLYTLAVVIEATGYSESARLFPLVIGVPFLGMIVLKLALIALEDRELFASSELFDFEDRFDVVVGAEVEPRIRIQREATMMLWLAGLSLFLWAFGFILTLIVFLFVFVYVYERGLLRAIVASLVTVGFVYFFFIRLLGATVYTGAVTLGLPGPLP